MIESAIKALNKGEGSNEESISKYIKEKFDGLPWAHDVYLSHHLSKLCENGEIVLNPTSKCYTTPTRAVRRVCSSVEKQPYRKLKLKIKGCMINQKDGEGNSGEEKVVQGSGNLIGIQGEDARMVGNLKIKRRHRRLVFEDDDKVEGDETVGGVGVGDRNIIRRQNVAVPRTNEALALGNGDDSIEEWDYVGTVFEDDVSSDKRELEGISEKGKVRGNTRAAKSMLVPVENVEKSSLSLNTSSNDSEDAVLESGLRESDLMIVPYVENTLEQRYPLVICGLAELPNQEQQISEKSTKKKLKSSQVKKKVSSDSMLDFPDLAVDAGNLLEHDEQPGLLSLRPSETKVDGMDNEIGQPWLMPMLKGQYFIPCSVHVDVTRNECNMFCLDCIDDTFCHHCLLLHDKNHRVVQIRKASYRNSVRVHEIEKHIDISHIQTYVINSAKIVFLNARAEPKPSKGYSKSCESCLQSLIDRSRFCSLGCKFFGTPQESSKFLELVADQSQQANSLEDGFIEQLERHKYLNPPRLKSLEDEENLPLHKVLKKCAKRKRHVVHKPARSTPLAKAGALSNSELTSTKKEKKQWRQKRLSKIETNSIVERKGSTLGSISEMTALELELETDDDGMLFTDFGPPGFAPTELIRSNYLQSEKKRQNLAIFRPSLLDSSSFQNPEHQLGDQERQDCENYQIQEGLYKSAISQNLKQKKKFMKVVGKRRPRKEKGAIKEVKRGPRGRPRKHMEASKEDKFKLLNVRGQEQERVFKPIHHHLKKDGHEMLQKNLEANEEVEPTSLNLYIEPQEGPSELTISQSSLLNKDGRGRLQKQLKSSSKNQIKGLKKKRGRPRKIIEPVEEDAASLSTLDPLQLLGSSSRQVAHRLSPVQDRKKKKDGQGRPLKQKKGNENNATVPMILKFGAQKRKFEAQNCEHSQQNNRTLKKDGWKMPQKQNEKINDEDDAASKSMHLKESKQLSNDGQGRLRKQVEVNKENSAAPMNLPYQLEETGSVQEKENKADDSPNAKPEHSDNEVQKQKLSSERATSGKGPGVEEKNSTWLDGPVDEPEKSQNEVHGVLETQLETPPSGNDKQLTREQEELQICHEPEINEVKLESQVGSIGTKSTKVTLLHIPLSSKDQLRSRINRQTQDST